MQRNQIQWTQWCHPSIAKAIEPSQGVNTIEHTNPINQPKQAKQWHESYQTNQANQSNQSHQACRQEAHSTKQIIWDWIGWDLPLLGCMGLPWLGIACTASLIVWFWGGLSYWTWWLHWIVLDMLWVALIWFIEVFFKISCAYTSLDLTWFQLITLIDWLFLFFFAFALWYSLIAL